VLPVAALLGALLVSVADTLGRTVIAPGQLPAGLLAALVGTPYFVWLLWRSRLQPVRARIVCIASSAARRAFWQAISWVIGTVVPL
jgi:FecCD transport family